MLQLDATGSTRTMCKICSKLTIKIPERLHWCLSSVFLLALNKFFTLFLFFHCQLVEQVNDG